MPIKNNIKHLNTERQYMHRKINFKCTSYYKVFIEHEIINIEKLTCSTLLHTRYYPGTQPVTYVCPYVVR